MSDQTSILSGKTILAVDDETDILESIEDILYMAKVDTALDYDNASRKIKTKPYDLAILDIMGVHGLRLLEECVAKGVPAVMLTAHAVNPETLMASIRKGAISYLPKESLADLDKLLHDILSAHQRGEAPWKLLFTKLGNYFNDRFGPDWQQKDKDFWSEFSRTYQVGKGIQERLKHDSRVKGAF
jgi:DNA-binding response OmpR family regulator